jgi:ornithine cyclodeaminase/alanine dehydrogenase-like protein (mu-crystallin family)
LIFLAIRTAAASAVATDILARADASSLAILGCGHQAVKHLQAMKVVRKITQVKVYSRTFANSKKFAEQYSTPDCTGKFSVSVTSQFDGT